MPEMLLKDAVGFSAWAKMLVNNKESYFFGDANAQLSFYRDDDSAYLVVNIFVGEKGIWEYVFLPANDEDRGVTVGLVFDFLKTVDFSLDQLLSWLKNSTYIDTEMGERISASGLMISREYNECA